MDASNIEALYRDQNPGSALDFGKLARIIESWEIDLVAMYIFLPQRPNNEGYLGFLSSSGYRVVSKPVRDVFDGSGGEAIGRKANFDVEIAVTMTLMATGGRIDEFYLLSGDSDFEFLIKAIQQMPYAIRVNVFSPRQGTAAELKRFADRFISMDEYFEGLSKSNGRVRTTGTRREAVLAEPVRVEVEAVSVTPGTDNGGPHD